MGAHGISPFDDDAGADFGAEIVEAVDTQVLADALFGVPDEDDKYVEHDAGVRALVAAELVAAMLARESGDVPDDLQSWVEGQGDADDVLIERARRAVRRVLRDSETLELWRESSHFQDWKQRVEGLVSRLSV